MSLYPDLYKDQDQNGDVNDPLVGGDQENPQIRKRCYENSDDWDHYEHDQNNRKANCSLFLVIVSVIFGLWPLCIFSWFMVRKIKKRMGSWHRHWCKVSTAYYLSIFGIIFGIIEWVIAILALYKRYYN